MNAAGKIRLALTCLLAIYAVSATAIDVVPGEGESDLLGEELRDDVDGVTPATRSSSTWTASP